MKARSRQAPPPPPSSRRRRRLLAALRRSFRLLSPLLLAAAGYGAFAASRTSAGEAAFAAAEARALQASAALGLVVGDIEVVGRKTTDVATIKAALGADRGTPILAVSPSRAQRRLESLPWVRSATIERRLPSTLFVRLVERQPLAVWQHDGRQELIDLKGEVIPVADLGRFSRLPTVVGDNANIRAAALFEMLKREPELAARVTAAVRVDDRRWNVRVDRSVDVLLPEEDPAGAWTKLAALERSKSVLKRDVVTVDMRLPDRLVVRVTAAAPNAPAKEAPPAKKPRQAGKNT